MTPSLITIIIPIYDRAERMLRDAIDSALGQGDVPVEVIVVDDGSANPVAPIVESYDGPVSCHYQPNGGIGAARNAGIRLSNGEFLSFLDSDDVWATDKLESQLAAFNDNPRLDAVFGQAEQFYDEEVGQEFMTRHPMKQRVIDAWLSTAMLIRTDAFHRVGWFTEEHSGGVDLDWFMRAREIGLERQMIEQVVYRRRIHTSNIGVTSGEENNQARLHALRASLHRRRAAGDDPAAG